MAKIHRLASSCLPEKVSGYPALSSGISSSSSDVGGSLESEGSGSGGRGRRGLVVLEWPAVDRSMRRILRLGRGQGRGGLAEGEDRPCNGRTRR